MEIYKSPFRELPESFRIRNFLSPLLILGKSLFECWQKMLRHEQRFKHKTKIIVSHIKATKMNCDGNHKLMFIE